MESNTEEKALFRVYGSMEIKPNKDGGYSVHRLGDAAHATTEDWFVMDRLDGYEPLNEAAEELKLKDLLRLGFQPVQSQAPTHESRGELLASGKHAFTVMMRGMQKISERYGFHFGIEQSCNMYSRRTLMTEEHQPGAYVTHFYLADSRPRAPLPLVKSDAPVLRDALVALREAGNCDTGRVDALLEALRDL